MHDRRLAMLGCLLMLAVTGIGCSPEAKSTSARGSSCGEPKVEETVRAELVPEELTLGGRVASTGRVKRAVSAVVILDHSVKSGYEAYLQQVGGASYEVIGSDFEGFEAEVYLKKGEGVSLVQLRRTNCDAVTLAYLRLLPATTH